jgi:O-antigen/teichoic acid export membrane protein
LEKMDGLGAVGVYSQASRLFGTFLFVPNAIGMALLPSLARLASASATEFRTTQLRVLSLLVTLALPVTAVMIVLAHPISHLLYGAKNFTEMPLVLQVYALAVLPMYLVTTLYQFLVAQNRGRTWTGVLLLTVGLYALFSALLIPIARDRLHNGAVGAVGATVLSETFSVIFAFALLKNSPFDGPTLGRILRALFATACMAGVMWLTQSLFVLIPLTLGFLTFGLLAWFLKVLGAEEQAKIVGLVRRKLRR